MDSEKDNINNTSESVLNGLMPTGLCEDGRMGLLAGPCSVESRELVEADAAALAALGIKNFRAGIWKPRTRPGCFEGIGAEGLAWVANACSRNGLTPYVEVATGAHVEQCLDFGIDHFWIGARTTVNPFAVQAVADMLGRRKPDAVVLVKNPVNPDLELWIGAMQRLLNAGVKRIGAVHRGFSSYNPSPYRNEPYWKIPLELMRREPGLEIFCDPSHIAGRRGLVEDVSQQAMDMKFRGLVIEVHPRPAEALSDSAQQLSPEDFDKLLKNLIIRDKSQTDNELARLRSEIDATDDALMEIIGRRLRLAEEIGRYKKANGMPAVQPQRYGELIARRSTQAKTLGLSQDFIRRILAELHEESVKIQLDIINNSDRNPNGDKI